MECLSDSSSSPSVAESSKLFNNSVGKDSNHDSDCDSDSTIIEMNVCSIAEKYAYQSGRNSEFSKHFNMEIDKPSPSTYDSFSPNTTSTLGLLAADNSSKKNVMLINKSTSSDNKCSLDLDKSLTSNYCNGNDFYIFSDKVDPELEFILKKYTRPPLISVDANRSSKSKSLVTFTSTNNKNDELIELSSDEDVLPQTEIKKQYQAVTGTETGKNKIDIIDKQRLANNYEFELDENTDPPKIQIKSRGPIKIGKGITSVANEELLRKNEPMSDEDENFPQIQLKGSKATSTKTRNVMFDADNDEFSKQYKHMFNSDKELPWAYKPTSTITSRKTSERYIEVLENETDFYKSPKRKRKLTPDKEKKKAEKAAQNAKKREEAEKAKMLKQALLTANKNMKPEECMKFITVLLDTEIANEKYGGEVLNSLQAAGITYRIQSQVIPYTVTWNRQVETHLMDEGEQVTPTSSTVETSEALLIMNWKQIIELVHNSSLVMHIQSIQSILAKKKLCLAIYGMENYFKYQKNQKQQEVRSEITQTSRKTNNKFDKIYKDVPKIGKKQFEFALTELQLLCCCCNRMIENSQDLGTMIAQFTKAIAQAPYKLEKYQKQQEADWYISGDNKDCVRVDKNGNGLQRLWQQQLTTFPLARLEHAEAIVAKYPTPTSLMKEYSSHTQSEGEKLLQDIPIRRAAGPLTTVRKIGPELSKKMYKFFTSLDGDVML